jgi:capsid protein
MTQAGTPIRFHVVSWGAGGTSPAGYQTRPISADAAELILNPTDDTVGMVRGEPGLQAILPLLERIDAFIDKTLLAAEIATLMSLIVTHPQPNQFHQAMVAASDASADAGVPGAATASPQVDLQAGGIVTMPPGSTVEQVRPEHPTTNFREFIQTLIMIAAADGAGLPVAATHLDATGLSWSNIKALLAMGYRGIEIRQARLARVVRRLRSRMVRQWIDLGMLPPIDEAELDKVAVLFPQAPVLDFASESKGYGEAVLAGLMTSDEATQRLGTGTAESVTRAIADEQKLRRDLGVVTTAAPGSTQVTGTTGGGTGGQNATDGTDGTNTQGDSNAAQ